MIVHPSSVVDADSRRVRGARATEDVSTLLDHRRLRSMEGRWVSVALADGSRVDGGQLVAVARHGVNTLWLFADGVDAFLNLDEIVDVWEAA